MFGSGSYSIRCNLLITLVASHIGLAHFCSQVRIFSKRFVDSGPERIYADIEDGSEIPVMPQAGRFIGRYPARVVAVLRIKGGPQVDVMGKDGASIKIACTVNVVDAVNDRYIEPALLHGKTCKLIGELEPRFRSRSLTVEK